MDRASFVWELRLWLILSAARRRRVVHHVELAEELAPLVDLPPARVEDLLHDALAEIERYESAAGRPMLTSLVVSSISGVVTDGYVACARSLGHQVDDSPEGRVAFWESQCQQVYACWAAPDGPAVTDEPDVAAAPAR
ncbi:hypothetical protein [Rugosimonospora africana]|uniref:Uncharacterized protein n=1 Tax=Rugosimonospora africana TaxID=556532 RepID=A0A8J3QJ58_9ACTN|nr:hypothetical protein [Rugosimonospora africana]GIH11880.1 hypothetical protein Raf01_00520 [Rugosimonospora africana]